MKWRRIIFGIIIIICIIAVNYGVYWTVNEEGKKQPETPEVKIDIEKIVKDFKNIFNNTLDNQEHVINNVVKLDTSKELVFTDINTKQKIDGKYEIDINIPKINIAKNSIELVNEEIYNIFYSKVNSIMSQHTTIGNELLDNKATNTVVYEVSYKAYLNSNILSLVIKANLKEGANEQRTFLKKYNFNLTTYEQINIKQLRDIKGLNNQIINAEIQEVVRSANVEASTLETLGYSVYIRDEKSDIYNIEKTTDLDCFLGKEQILYIIYPYGNKENTTEMDIIVFE